MDEIIFRTKIQFDSILILFNKIIFDITPTSYILASFNLLVLNFHEFAYSQNTISKYNLLHIFVQKYKSKKKEKENKQ